MVGHGGLRVWVRTERIDDGSFSSERFSFGGKIKEVAGEDDSTSGMRQEKARKIARHALWGVTREVQITKDYGAHRSYRA